MQHYQFRETNVINVLNRFIPRTTEKNYLDVYPNGGCESYIGMQGGKQRLDLTPGCAGSIGTPIHEMMHAIGK